jgi:hypothetical protein
VAMQLLSDHSLLSSSRPGSDHWALQRLQSFHATGFSLVHAQVRLPEHLDVKPNPVLPSPRLTAPPIYLSTSNRYTVG